MIVVCVSFVLRVRAVMTGWVKDVGGFAFGGVDGVGGMGVSGGGRGCCGLCMRESISSGVYEAGVVGEVVVGGGCSRGEGVQALHSRRFS